MSGISNKALAGGTGFSAEFRIDGLEETLAALRMLDRDVYAGLVRGLRPLVSARRRRRRRRSARRQGRLLHAHDHARQERGVKVGARAGSVAGRNAAIFEFAGTRGQSRPAVQSPARAPPW